MDKNILSEIAEDVQRATDFKRDDRSVVIILTAIVDDILYELVWGKPKDDDDFKPFRKTIFNAEETKLISEDQSKSLNRAAIVRNRFAHTRTRLRLSSDLEVLLREDKNFDVESSKIFSDRDLYTKIMRELIDDLAKKLIDNS